MELEEGKNPVVADWLDALDLDQKGLHGPWNVFQNRFSPSRPR